VAGLILFVRGSRMYHGRNSFLLAISLLVLVISGEPFLAHGETTTAYWEPLIQRLTSDGQDETWIRHLFSDPEVKFDPRVMPRKLTHSEAKLDYSQFLRPERISRASRFLKEHRGLLASVEKQYRVPKEVKVAILLVETDLGRFMGSGPALNILASMALASDIEAVSPWLPPEILAPGRREEVEKKLREKSEWAYGELRALLQYADRNHLELMDIKGSIFGAIGLCQFMPSNALRFGMDYDGDGRVDLFSKGDAVASMANYLRNYGWREGLSRKNQEKVLLKYNYSRPYAKTVMDVAEKLREADRDGYAVGGSSW
jgi:membrane-bound lytic murein transglycosylase B